MLCYHPLVRSNSLSRILDVSPCHCANDLIADGNRPYKQLATKNLPKIRTIGGKRSRELSGNNDSTGYVAVALPVGSLAGEEGVVRRRLRVAIDVERPRRDFVLTRGGRPPVEPPEPPRVAT